MVLYDPCALGAHHFLGIGPALVHSCQDSFFGRVRVASATVDEHGFYELFHLLFELFVGNWLVEQGGEFSICALETGQ